jgi:predicted MFS family arabinose efflux permease
MAIFFLGGAVGSALSASLYARAGWAAVVALGCALPTIAFVYRLGERKVMVHREGLEPSTN